MISVLIIVCLYSYVTNITETYFVCCEGPPKPLGKQKVRSGHKSSLSSWCWPIPLCDAVENKAGNNVLAWSSCLNSSLLLFPAAAIPSTGMETHASDIGPVSLSNTALGPWFKDFVLALCS